MALLSSGKLLPRKASNTGGSRALLFAALLACAALIAVEAAPLRSPPSPPKSKSPPKPVVSKPPPKPVVSKPPPKPVVSKPPPKPIVSKPPPKPVVSKPPPKPVVSKPPPKPIVSKPPPKPVVSKPPPSPPKIRGNPPPFHPDTPPYPMHVDPFFCHPCVTIYGNVGYSSQNVFFHDSLCQNVTERIYANLTSTLTTGNATVLGLNAECSSPALIRICGSYYFWTTPFEDSTGSKLAADWLSYLVQFGPLPCGDKAPGTQVSLTAMIQDDYSSLCLGGSASATWYCA